MTQDEIIEMAMQAGLYSGNPRTPSTGRMIEKRLEAFAKLVDAKATAREREACAKVCDDIDAEYEGEDVLATWCSKAIRARGEA